MRLLQKVSMVAWVLLMLSTQMVQADDWTSGWTSMDESALTRRSAEPEAPALPANTQGKQQSEGRSFDSQVPDYSNSTDVVMLIEQIINSRREGRNLGEYDQVYADGNIDEALQSGNDFMARNLIRDKLCMLGLMSCDVEEKRPYYSTIYAQGPPPPNFGGGPYGPPKPMPPPGVVNGRPPPSLNGFTPPRKVGYESGPVYKPNYKPPGQGPFYNGPYVEQPPTGNDGVTFNKPPPGAIIYGSKPPGSIYSGNSEYPSYNFDKPKVDTLQTASSHRNDLYAQHSSSSASSSASTSKVVIGNVDALANAALQQHVHHHYHHVDGEGSQTAKIPSVSIPVGAGQAINTDFSTLAQSSTAFSPITQGGFSQTPAFNAGFQSASQGGLLSQGINSFGPNNKPAGLGGANYLGGGLNGFVGTSNSGNHYQQGTADTTDFEQGGFGSGVTGNHYSQNPDYFKKHLQSTGGISATNGLNNFGSNAGFNSGSNSGYNGGFNDINGDYNSGVNGGSLNGGYDTARNQLVDCQCVPFNQCPAADRIGRKEDLILPIDPRNLADKDIKALSDSSAADITPSDISDAENKDAEKTDENDSNRSKRQAVAQDKQSDDITDISLDTQGRPAFAAALPALLPALQAIALKQRKILPSYGVSLGLPYPTGAYPVNPQGDFNPSQSPHSGFIGPNGLNLGLVNVNPFLSVQVAKTYYGEKVVKPYVNFHVTPNANILEKIADIFRPKSQAMSPEMVYNTHYHDHHHYFANYKPDYDHYQHQHYKPQSFTILEMVPSKPIFEYHSSEAAPLYQPILSEIGYGQAATEDVTKQKFYYSNAANTLTDTYQQPLQQQQTLPLDTISGTTDISYLMPYYGYYTPTGHVGDYHYENSFGGGDVSDRSANVSQASLTYNIASEASKYQEYNLEPQRRGRHRHLVDTAYSLPTPAPGSAEGSASITFPRDRRRRSAVEPNAEDEITAGESLLGQGARNVKRAYYGQRPVEKTCHPNEVCCRRPLHLLQQQQQAPQYGRCGVRNAAGITGRIKNPVYVDGDSEFGEYPWHVAILKKDPKESIYACGGTLIDAQHVITAAHCIKSQNGFDLRARLGEWDVNHDVEFFPYIERDIVSVHIHPEYYAGTLENDLAVLKLDQPVDFTKSPHISPACLPDKFSDFTGARCWTTGWGKDAFGEQGKYQNILKEVDVPILSQLQCETQLRNTRLGYGYKLNPGFVCAGGEEGKDACKGDGGGPLVCERNGAWNVVGVVSWGIGCGQVNVPGVYVRVAHYLDWIRQITQYYK